jgi:UDP-N-acetylmuramoyl-tripeptide--D-alanyl-D-alanine ligase
VRLPLEAAVAATGATLLYPDLAPAKVHVSTDTRAIEPGDTFVALRGERFDGHDFVAEAARRGAAMVVIERAEALVDGTAAMLVGEAKSAYMALAAAARRRFENRVVAITGSAGKTTTKSFLAQLLAVKYGDRVLCAPANENNEIGVSKLLLNASNEAHDVLVVEMGARHYGDVAALVEIARPQIGILTNIAEAHLEIMGSHERLEETKWALFSQGALAILNAADAASRRRAAELHCTPHWFTAEEDSVAMPRRKGEFTKLTMLLRERVVDRADGKTAEHSVRFHIRGEHNRANAAAAVAGALEMGVQLVDMLAAISSLRLPEGRYDSIPLESGIRLIYDAYNANPAGMIAALDAFASEAASRRIAVLASMAELGSESQALHERVGGHAASRVDMLVVLGEYARDFVRGATRGGLAPAQIVFVETNAQAAAWLREHAKPDDVVLLKGSRKYKLEEIVEELRS